MIFGPTGNLSTLAAQRAMQMNALAWMRALTRLSTGLAINSGADSPAGLIASESLQASLVTLDAESSSDQRAISQAAVADGALSQVSDLLTQAKGLVLANANEAGLSTDEKQANQLQIDAILTSVDRISSTTSFNGRQLLDGSTTLSASGMTLAIASTATSDIGQVQVDSGTYSLADLRTGQPLNTVDGDMSSAGEAVDAAINDISTLRGQLGSYQSDQLSPRLTQIDTARQSLTSALSLIRDTDYAMEMSRDIRYQILYTASAKVLGIAMRTPRLSILA